MVKPFGSGPMLQQACPMADILSELAGRLQELEQFKQEASTGLVPA